MALSRSDVIKTVEDNNIRLQSVVGYNISSQGGTVLTADGFPADLTSTIPNAGGADSGSGDTAVDSVITYFGTQRGEKDVLELHIYNPVEELLESVYNAPYKSYRGLPGGGNNDLNNVEVNLHSIFRGLGYVSGKFIFQLNFHRHVLGSDTDLSRVTSISSDRSEVTITYPGIGELELEPTIDFYGNRLEYYLNAGENLLYRISAVRRDEDLSTDNQTVYILTLAEPLPIEFGLGQTFWVDLQVADSKVDSILVIPGQVNIDDLNYLRGPNFNVNVHSAQSTALRSWDDILGSNPTSSQQLINKFVSSSFNPIELPIDYRDYSQFVFYGSATDRLDNFRYKVKLVEYYQDLLAASTNIANPYIDTNYQDISRKLNNLIAGFDGYENYLYFQSSSYESSSYGEFTPSTWPKQNSTEPYTLFSYTSSEAVAWYEGQRESASYYDRHNNNALYRLIPEHIIVDYYNEDYITFVNMIGQHFDILWSYVKQLSKISSREESLNAGLAKDLVYHVLRSHGLETAHGFKLEELWLDALGLNASGSYTQTGSLHSIPSSDISKETFKRILNNLPYLLKTKGTKRGIRALLNCYGVPSTVYRVKEFSGPYQYSSSVFDNDAVYRQVEKFTLAAYLSGSATISAPGGGTTRMFRFKPVGTASFTIGGNALVHVDGVYGTLAGVSGPWYNGYWTLVTDQGYAFQCINGRVIEYAGGFSVGTTFGPAEALVQEIKGFNQALTLPTLREHARNPQSQIGNDTVDVYATPGWQLSDDYDYTSAYMQMVFRFPMGTTLQTYGNGSIPSITTNPAVTSAATLSGFTSASYVGNVEDYYIWYPNLADSLDIAEKIRIESSSISGSLRHDASIEKNQFDFYSFDSPKIGVYFSPQDEINEDIADQFSGLSMDNLIGDPRYDYESGYPELEAVARHYHLKYTGENQFWKYYRLVENFDASMFYLIKSFLPARAVKMVGLVIQPTLLERSKIPQLGNVFVEDVELDADFGQVLPDNVSGENYGLDANIENIGLYVLKSENLLFESTVNFYSPANILGEVEHHEGTVVALPWGDLSINVDNVMQQAGIRHIPTGVFNHTYGGCKISSRAVNIPSPDTFDGAPVIEIWSTSPNAPINTSGPGGALTMANSPNTSGGRFNAIFPNGLTPVVPVSGLNGRAVVNFNQPISSNRMMNGVNVTNPFPGPTPTPGPLGGRVVTNVNNALNGRAVTNFMDPAGLQGRVVTNFLDPLAGL